MLEPSGPVAIELAELGMPYDDAVLHLMKRSSAAKLLTGPLPRAPMVTSGAATTMALIGITALGLLLRLYRLDAASFWSDEAFSGYWIQRDLGFIWTDGLFIETTPPLYYMLLKIWAAVAGDGDFALRLFSAIASAITIPLVFLLAVQIAAVPAALVSALLFALAPMQIFYAQEARVYTLVSLFFALTLLGLLRFVRRSLAAVPAQGRIAAHAPLALFTAGAALLIYAHATSVFTVAALSICGGGMLLTRPAGREALPRFLLANLVVAVLALPELYAIMHQAGRFDLDWISPPDLVAVLNLLNNLLIDPVTPQSLFRLSCILSCGTVALLGLTLPFLRLERNAAVLLFGVPILFLVAVIGLSFWSPFLIPRIIIWIGVPFSIIAGMALVSPAPRLMRGGLAIALAACVALGLQGVYVRTLADKQDWRGAMAKVLSHLSPDDMVVLGPGTSVLPMLRYAEGIFDDHKRAIFRWAPRPLPPDLYVHHRVQAPTALTTEALAAAAHQGRRIWLLMPQYDWVRNADAKLLEQMPPATIDRSYAMIMLLSW
ncbi:hypothetical protein GCM10011504_52120 [Siccirubricoccus deserti]|uniref:Glycosyltransferase family 39 protein n=1 Tax=Siccirubricoccus deserti TaxID=2013562 RepID=A0A9X0UG63_9PROT|nr:glycosyltransferase family 39 protein [Siccirubricoccus deserti]MBC4018686.1 glycosyltransferase family 39 protein [Siccirubricoccus deserti]GGC67719.1 hypothetical protein GCM10011504_52120 [Siccirubricoccus deserti]